MIFTPIFKSQDYRKIIRLAFDHKSPHRKKTYAAAATFCQVQPTYFSNVIKGRSDFSDDQIYSLCEYLELGELEAEYLKACHQWARSGHRERRQGLQEKITQLKEQALSPASRFKATKASAVESENEVLYHLDPLHQVLMLYIGLHPELKNFDAVKTELGLSQNRLDGLLDNLLALGKIKIEKGRYVKTTANYHLASDSKILFPHQASVRQASVERMRQLPRKDFKAFSVSFGASQKDREAVEEILTSTLEKIREVTTDSGHTPDTVYQINFDFFPWLK